MGKRLLIVLMLIAQVVFSQEKRTVIIDADTANEVDDLFAITRGLIEPSWNVTALNATQWQVSQWATANTMEDSYRLNIALVNNLELRGKVKLCRGAAKRLFDWGDKAQHSEAAYEIIKQGNAMPSGEKLNVVVLGALTNVASAILIDPEITNKIAVYWLGTSYDFEKKKAKLIDFNAVMDIQATDIMLSSKVEMHIIPNNVAAKMKFRFDETKANLKDKHIAADFLLKRWEGHVDAARAERVLWDLALVQSIIYHEKVKEVKADWFENPNVSVFQDFDYAFFKNEFFTSINKLSGK